MDIIHARKDGTVIVLRDWEKISAEASQLSQPTAECDCPLTCGIIEVCERCWKRLFSGEDCKP
jgi:hypothetical protein